MRRGRVELQAMSEQDLTDLGIGRGEIGALTEPTRRDDQARG